MAAERVREIDLHLTNRCNLTCWHCSVDSARTPYGEMSVADWKTVVDDAATLGVRYCDLTGGEPALFPGVERLITYIVGRGFRLELQSNGHLLDADRLRRLRDAGLPTVVISLDGDAARHDRVRGRAGTHAAAMAAIRTALGMGFDVRVTHVVVDGHDIAPLGPLARELDAVGITHLSVNLFSPVTPAHFLGYRRPDGARWRAFTAAIDELAAEVRYPISYEVAYARPSEIAEYVGEETRCLIERRRWFLIRADGEVFPCYHFVHRNEMSVGNVRATPLSRLIGDDNPRWGGYAGLHEVPHGCRGCAFETSCGGGCPSPGYLRHGSLAIKDLRCQVEEGFVPVCPFIKRTARTSHLTNISPYYAPPAES